MKLKLFTHNDLDGIGNIIIAKVLKYFNFYEDIDYEICDYKNINTKVLEYLDNVEENTELLFTDISVSEEVAEKIDKMDINKKLLDHHKSALGLNKYDWCTVKEVDDYSHLDKEFSEVKTCGSLLFFEYKRDIITTYLPDVIIKSLCDFILLIRSYDTWDWTKDDVLLAKHLNDLLFMRGRENFIEDMFIKITSGDFPINHQDYKDLVERQKEIDAYIDNKEKQVVEVNIKGLNAGVVIAENYISELADTILKRNIHLEILAVINGSTVSLRTKRTNIDLSKLAGEYGGGGHPQASGFVLKPEMLKKGFSKMFNDDNWERFENK